jgi:hypothetical protein
MEWKLKKKVNKLSVETSTYNLSNQEAESGASQGGEKQGYIQSLFQMDK